jgi:hypothetical protein
LKCKKGKKEKNRAIGREKVEISNETRLMMEVCDNEKWREGVE